MSSNNYFLKNENKLSKKNKWFTNSISLRRSSRLKTKNNNHDDNNYDDNNHDDNNHDDNNNIKNKIIPYKKNKKKKDSKNHIWRYNIYKPSNTTSILVRQNSAENYINPNPVPMHFFNAQLVLSYIFESKNNYDINLKCYEIHNYIRFLHPNNVLDSYFFDINQIQIIKGEKNIKKLNNNHVTFVLTSAPNFNCFCKNICSTEFCTHPIDRCNYIKECLENDIQSDEHIYIVMNVSDYENKTFLRLLNLDNTKEIFNKISIIIIPNGSKCAGYTRSWCVFLAGYLEETLNKFIWIRDDRRKLIPIKNNTIDYDKKIVDKSLLNIKLKDGVIYSPRGDIIWKKNGLPRKPRLQRWSQINQIICATNKTFKIINKLIVYPQGPILEDYAFNILMMESGFKCSDLGINIGITTKKSLISLARKDDTKNKYVLNLYDSDDLRNRAIRMSQIIRKYMSLKSFVDGHINLELLYFLENYTNDKSGNIFKFSNKTNSQGGGQTHALSVMHMIQEEKNKLFNK